MRSQRGAFILTVLLVVLLSLWWSMSNIGMPSVTSNLPVTPQTSNPMSIHHRVDKNVHVYTGNFPLRNCDSFSTQIKTLNGNPTRIELIFVFTPIPPCNETLELAPFSVSFSSSEKETPLLDTVFINKKQTAFIITEDN